MLLRHATQYDVEVRLQHAGTAGQHATHLGQTDDLVGILRGEQPTVQVADTRTCGACERHQAASQVAVHLGDLLHRGYVYAPDRPARLVRDCSRNGSDDFRG